MICYSFEKKNIKKMVAQELTTSNRYCIKSRLDYSVQGFTEKEKIKNHKLFVTV